MTVKCILARWATLCIALVPLTSDAGEFRPLYIGARSLAMGGAYVGLADDEQSVFLNPAGLAGVKNYQVNYLAADASMSTDIIEMVQDGIASTTTFSGDTLNLLVGRNIYNRAQYAPTIVIPNFGIGLLSDFQAALYARNRSLPEVTFGYQNTNGVQVAWGTSLGKNRRRRGEFRFGLGAKMLWRRGGYRRLTMDNLFNIQAGLLAELTGNFRKGYGGDAGLQYVYHLSRQAQISVGSAFTEIGDIHFEKPHPDLDEAGADIQYGNLAVGAAYRYESRWFQTAIAYDYAHILAQTDWRKKSHAGIEVGSPILLGIKLYGGINQVYYTYGATMDIWLFKLYAVNYAEELGSFAHQIPQRRYLLKFIMNFEL